MTEDSIRCCFVSVSNREGESLSQRRVTHAAHRARARQSATEILQETKDNIVFITTSR